MTIGMQAEDFFNAYQVLRESNEAMMDKLVKLAGKPLVSATAFGALPTMSPTIVCLAFSVELYIKDVYYAFKLKPPRSHNILKLYAGLPEQVKREIFAHEAISQNPFATRGTIFSSTLFTNSYDGFLSQIQAISDGFEKWRYSYENGSLQYNEWFALAFIEAIRSVAHSARNTPTSTEVGSNN